MSKLVGRKAPDFKAQALVNGDFQEISLSDYKGKWKVLFFYPLDFTFVCPTELVAYSDAADKFKEKNAELIACSIDSVFSHLAWTQQDRKDGGLGDVNFPILSDMNKTIATDYDVLADDGVALRGIFIIDENDIVQQATVNNLSVGRNVEETLRLLAGYQYTAEHGEVCPANWTEGDDSMKPNPSGSKEWFNKHK